MHPSPGKKQVSGVAFINIMPGVAKLSKHKSGMLVSPLMAFLCFLIPYF